MTPEERIEQLEQQMAEMRKLIGLPVKPQQKNKDRRIRQEFRKKLLKLQ